MASFVIGAHGAVRSAAVGGSTRDDPPTERCIVGAARLWIFPAPDGGGVVGVNYPFNLTSTP